MTIEDEIMREVRAWVRNARPDDRLVHDLRLFGDDFDEFVDWFSKRFGISLAGLEGGPFRPDEGGGFLPAIVRIGPQQEVVGFVPITSRDFVQIAEAGSLEASGLIPVIRERRPETAPPPKGWLRRLVFELRG